MNEGRTVFAQLLDFLPQYEFNKVMVCHFKLNEWSRREELNTPSADYRSAALTLSYTGTLLSQLNPIVASSEMDASQSRHLSDSDRLSVGSYLLAHARLIERGTNAEQDILNSARK
jgi:hypothetical protein